jgi:hypothetical protein
LRFEASQAHSKFFRATSIFFSSIAPSNFKTATAYISLRSGHSITESEIRKLLNNFGELKTVDICTHIDQGYRTIYGLIDFAYQGDFAKALHVSYFPSPQTVKSPNSQLTIKDFSPQRQILSEKGRDG